MMKWRPWPPLLSKKYEVILIVRKLVACDLLRQSSSRLTVEIKWKGPKSALGSLRRNIERNFTTESEVVIDQDDSATSVVIWDEEFQNVCNLNAYKHNLFHPWEIAFTIFHVT